MILMDGKKLRDKKMNELKGKVGLLNKVPHLVVVQVGNDSYSNIYIKYKERAAKELNIKFTKIKLAETISFEELKKEISNLNNDSSVDGMIVQFPLPKGISKRQVSALIDPKKDADGVHPNNQGDNLNDENIFSPIPCTPNGVMELFKEYNIEFDGKNIVVIGRSSIVGKPMASMLNNAGGNVSLINLETSQEKKEELLKKADIIVTATGSKDVFDASHVKRGVVIADVGIIRDEGKLRGDIEYKKFDGIASHITPVPGGVGPMTVAMLMHNIISIVEKK